MYAAYNCFVFKGVFGYTHEAPYGYPWFNILCIHLRLISKHTLYVDTKLILNKVQELQFVNNFI